MITEEIRMKIDELRQQGLGARKIAKELNIPLHHINHYIYRKSDHKPIDVREAETKNLIKEVNKIKNRKNGLPRIAFNANSLKSVLYFSEFQNEIDSLVKMVELKKALILHGTRLSDAMDKGIMLDKKELQQIRVLGTICREASNMDKNMSTKIKEMLISVVGLNQAGLIQKQIMPIEVSQEDKNAESTNMVKLKGIF